MLRCVKGIFVILWLVKFLEKDFIYCNEYKNRPLVLSKGLFLLSEIIPRRQRWNRARCRKRGR